VLLLANSGGGKEGVGQVGGACAAAEVGPRCVGGTVHAAHGTSLLVQSAAEVADLPTKTVNDIKQKRVYTCKAGRVLTARRRRRNSSSMDDALRPKASQETFISLLNLDPAPMETPPDTEKDLPPLPEHPEGGSEGPRRPPLPASSSSLGLSGSGSRATYFCQCPRRRGLPVPRSVGEYADRGYPVDSIPRAAIFVLHAVYIHDHPPSHDIPRPVGHPLRARLGIVPTPRP